MGRAARAWRSAGALARLHSAAWIEVRPDPPLEDLGLDGGETAAILLAEQIGADLLLMDERLGRAVATSRGHRVLGVLGVVAAAKRAGLLPRAAPVVEALRNDGFRLADGLVARVLRDLGER